MSAGTRRYNVLVETKRFIYYEEEGIFVGWLEEYPDYRTQAESIDELRESLLEIHRDVTSGQIPCIRKVGELSIA